jgi:hypothetical protein
MKKIYVIILHIIKIIYAKINPVSYARKIGVNIGNDVKIFGSSSFRVELDLKNTMQ